MNKIIIIGNVVRDPELNVTQNGKKLCKLTVAVGRAFDKEKTDFFGCTAWEQKAELIAKYVKKGNRIGIVGRMETSETEKDGVKTRHHDIMVEDIEFLTPKSESSGTGQATQDEGASSEQTSSVAKIKSKVEPLKINAEDLPF